MANWIDVAHMETCRQKSCNTMGNRSTMVKASIVRNQPNARGWYCQPHADIFMGIHRGSVTVVAMNGVIRTYSDRRGN